MYMCMHHSILTTFKNEVDRWPASARARMIATSDDSCLLCALRLRFENVNSSSTLAHVAKQWSVASM